VGYFTCPASRLSSGSMNRETSAGPSRSPSCFSAFTMLPSELLSIAPLRS